MVRIGWCRRIIVCGLWGPSYSAVLRLLLTFRWLQRWSRTGRISCWRAAWDLPAVDCEWRAEYRSVLPAFCDGEHSEGGEGSERLEELHS